MTANDVNRIVGVISKLKIPEMVNKKLVSKLLITQSLAEEYVAEYKRFLLMAACSKFMVSPSEQVDHVWHLHQICTKEYRDFCFEVFGQAFKH